MVITNSSKRKKGKNKDTNSSKRKKGKNKRNRRKGSADTTREGEPAWMLINAIHNADVAKARELLYGTDDGSVSPEGGIFDQMGIDLADLSTQCGMTLMHLAAESGSVEILELLTAKGLEPNTCHESGITPIEMAVRGNSAAAIAWLLA
eukprot:CAMPEP_0194561620 /NCGR_PEP_ID=MMETSP0292-20121207/2346_1 /TAXON_ID=39354 /ORGANISM="Heterosigma akashiwo, Strain CCMP2393" /LENGTH=148 /DNA_ID=CAMNT_0039410073 /DNA_START=68 /DNA_END=511 /DNA_ORIENTATION=+